MKKAFAVICCIFKILIIIVLCLQVTYLCLAAMNVTTENGFVMNKSHYGENPLWLAGSADRPIDEIYDNSDAVGKVKTAYDMYVKACEKLMLTKAYGIRATSDIDVIALGLSLTCASNRTEQYEVAGTPVLNANQKVYSSYVNTVYITQVSDPGLESFLKSVVQIANRGYSDGTENYIQKGSLDNMDGEDEVITWNTDYKPENLTAQRVYKDDEIRDKCNFIVNMDTIIPESVVIEREYDDKAGMYLYHLSMNLYCDDDSENGATYYEAKAIKDLIGDRMKSLVYSQLKIDATLYSNGYFMTWDTAQEWTLTFKLLFSELSGTALNQKKEMFSYHPDDCEVVNFTK